MRDGAARPVGVKSGMMTSIAPRPYRSFGNYLTIGDAVEMVGADCVEGWGKNDLRLWLDGKSADQAASSRCDAAIQRLRHWLAGDQVSAHTMDDEGAYVAIEPVRTSKPYFDINVARSLFKVSPDDWAAMFIDRRSLTSHLASIITASPRKAMRFRWELVTSIAWKSALDMAPPRVRSSLITDILLRCADELGHEPGEKELGPVVDDIIRHLDGVIVSKGV
jgi:hypothetical protein